MNRTPFAVYRQIRLAVSWYGKEYSFSRQQLNSYGEPDDSGSSVVQTLSGIYHSSNRSFIELINVEGASVKSKVSRGILCDKDSQPTSIQQGDMVRIENSDYYVTAVEPVLYSGEVVAYEISVDEVVEGNDAT